MKDAQPRPFHIRTDRELTHPQVLGLLDEHLAGMRAESPPECVFALDLNGLRRPEITFLTAWRLRPAGSPGTAPGSPGHDDDEHGELVAMGALKELAPTTANAGGHGELKSMRTSARHLRQGAAQAILTELLSHRARSAAMRASAWRPAARRRLNRRWRCTGGSGLWNAGRLRITGKIRSVGLWDSKWHHKNHRQLPRWKCFAEPNQNNSTTS